MNQKDINIEKIDFATRIIDVTVKDIPYTIDFDIEGADIVVTHESIDKIKRTSPAKMFIAQIIEARVGNSNGLKNYLRLSESSY